ncbi:DUF4199 domain-containing protein [Pontibacter sp. E15-1]|uniref:DUF4199 domain-containing protein n=1 Tax=Pontibacter sp. E15-1 TaxID=2919918 RepID=UPI001F4F244A|nr:DUF4199 domain-containing protein [Pontibacter sp. E15-1]MCJ8166215.1 DUF4199 domain-containing protein [Pontibacter sp. E15-1]
MASSTVTYQSVAIKYGILVGLAHIVYFILMWVLGLIENIELSFISGLFLVIGISVAISRFKRMRNGIVPYFEGLGIGATVGVVSSVILALFLMVFLTAFRTGYIENLQASALFPDSLTKLSLFVLTILYGAVPGLLIAFIAMQWFKRRDHSMPGQM